MFVLITGGSKSGKSMIAEKIAVSENLPVFYMATLMPNGEEDYKIIDRHKKMRSGKGFYTIEKYTNIGEIEIKKKSVLLIECIGNLCANEMFVNNCKNTAEKILKDIRRLYVNVESIIAVTVQTGDDGIKYSDETMTYISELGKLNYSLAELADCVIETVFGIPVILKGEKPDCL